MIFTIILIINNREELNNKNQIEFLFIKKNISRIIKYSTQNRNSLILLTITICLYSFFLYSKNFHESNFINIFFKKNSQTYKAIEVLDQKFTGSGMINLVLSSKKPDFFKKIEIFNQTNQLTKDLAKLPQITDIRSYHDPISQIHQEIATDESTLPQSDQELEQDILFIEMSRNENTKDILAKYVDFNYQDNRIVISTKNLNSRQLESLLNEITKIVNKSAISKQTSHSFAGQNIYFYKINQYITESFKSSILLTLVAIFIIMTIIYNAKLALISTIISAIPFLTILGIISALKIPLDYATIIIGATTFAIAIDNTIHLLDNYAKTKDLKKNLQTIYHPLTLNMFLFSLTFLIFCLSSLVLLNKFGFFSFLNIVIAFITNLFLTTILLSF